MKTSIKDIVIGAFAVIGFYVVVTGFNSPQAEPQVISATPESHIWETVVTNTNNGSVAILYNKQTGDAFALSTNGIGKDDIQNGRTKVEYRLK